MSQKTAYPPFYKRLRDMAAHRWAIWVLGGATIAESVISPLPPDFLLAPMVVARPEKAWGLAILTTICSVFGAVLGYLIGAFFMEQLGNGLVGLYNLQENLDVLTSWIQKYGAAIVFIGALSPIPYKAVAIMSGVALINPFLFIGLGLAGRGARFFAVAALCKYWGGAAEDFLLRGIVQSNRRNIVSLIFMAVVLVLAGVFFFEYVKGLPPCQLCLWQRIPYYVVAALTFISLFLFSEKIYYWVLVLAAICFLISTGLGAYHFGIELGWFQGFTQCAGSSTLATTLPELLAQLKTTQPVSCDQASWHLFGISLAGYNMLISLGLLVFIIWKLYGQKTN